MVATARLRGVDSVIPAKYRGVSFDRPPVTQMNEIVVRRVRDYCTAIDENIDSGRGLWFYGSSGTGKTTLAMLISRIALEAGRSVAIYSLPKLSRIAADTFDAGPASSPIPISLSVSPPSISCTSTTSAPRTARNGSWSSSMRSSTSATRPSDPWWSPPTSRNDELEEQIGARVVSRLVEMCGDPLPLFDDDRRMRVSADVATSLGESGGSALGPLDH